MRKLIILILCIVLALLSVIYGIVVFGTGSGTKFYLVWFAIALLFLAVGLCVFFGWWKLIPSLLRKVIVVLVSVGLLSFLVVEGFVISNLHSEGEANLDYVIVLGAQVLENGPSIVLQYRLDRAVEYLEENPDTICIVSGGQGKNEPFTEAEGMADYLIEQGIPKERLLLETESKTTEQNLTNSMEYVKPESTVGILTNDFHVFRALQIAKSQGIENYCGIAAGSSPKFLPNNMLREYFAEIKFLIKSFF